MSLPDIKVSDSAFAYLEIQRGGIWNERKDRKKWLDAYRRSLADDFETIQPWLTPGKPLRGVLDVGGGMAGIGLLLRHYQPGVPYWILDGVADPPKMQSHSETFSNAATCALFWRDNDEPAPGFLVAGAPLMIDLVISTQAWCFHFNPEIYLDDVRNVLLPGALLIVDVRRDYGTWRRILREAFEEVGIAKQTEKSERVVFRAA
jgi:SAM-dependent methyltransferase